MSRPDATRVFLWTCCYCGQGDMFVMRVPVCLNCGVARCQDCQIEARNERNAGSGSPVQISRARERTSIEGTHPLVAAGSFIATTSLVAAAYRTTSSTQYNSHTAATPTTAASSRQRRSFTASTASRSSNLRESTNLPATVEATVSTFPSVTPSVGTDAVEGFVHRILEFQSFEYLWPQLFERYGSKQRFVHIVEVLLKRYAKDLALVRDTMSASSKSNSRLCVTAARFIRKTRIQIAIKIWEALAPGMNNLGAKGYTDDQLITEAPKWELDEEDDRLRDDHLVFETIQEALFDRGPIICLLANIKLLISLWNPMETSTIYRLSSSMVTFIRNTISSLREPSIPPGYARLRYKCVSIDAFLFFLMLINFLLVREAPTPRRILTAYFTFEEMRT